MSLAQRYIDEDGMASPSSRSFSPNGPRRKPRARRQSPCRFQPPPASPVPASSCLSVPVPATAAHRFPRLPPRLHPRVHCACDMIVGSYDPHGGRLVTLMLSVRVQPRSRRAPPWPPGSNSYDGTSMLPGQQRWNIVAAAAAGGGADPVCGAGMRGARGIRESSDGHWPGRGHG
jgi:hypothetical protein